MAELKHSTKSRLRSARQWLVRAEQSFEKNRDIRGELDLLLAKAELQHVQENKQSKGWRYKSALLRHGLAFGLAVFIAAAGIGGAAYWTMQEREKATPIPLASQEKFNVPAKMETTFSVRPHQPEVSPVPGPAPAAPVQAEALTAPVAATVTRENGSAVRSVPNAQPATVSQAEMQRLVREAGKSLRGE